MSVRPSRRSGFALLVCLGLLAGVPAMAADRGVDVSVQRFLDEARHAWRDWNVPYEDGRILHDLIVAGGFTRILEIGTSTGHSAIWMAWAASKTGGKVTTIEIDPERHRQARENFRRAGVAAHVEAILADAHQEVRRLPGPFDFVFSDADKDWYPQYFRDLDPKLMAGGCFTAHNVLRTGEPGIRDFLELVRGRADYRTRIERGSGEGISVSCKVAR